MICAERKLDNLFVYSCINFSWRTFTLLNWSTSRYVKFQGFIAHYGFKSITKPNFHTGLPPWTSPHDCTRHTVNAYLSRFHPRVAGSTRTWKAGKDKTPLEYLSRISRNLIYKHVCWIYVLVLQCFAVVMMSHLSVQCALPKSYAIIKHAIATMMNMASGMGKCKFVKSYSPLKWNTWIWSCM